MTNDSVSGSFDIWNICPVGVHLRNIPQIFKLLQLPANISSYYDRGGGFVEAISFLAKK